MKPSISKINVVTLGCSKNVVDSEVILRQFEANGIQVVFDEPAENADVAVINTCGFINDAKEESIDVILEFAEAKKEGLLRELFVMGCLSERYKRELETEIPGVDVYFGVNSFPEILQHLQLTFQPELQHERHITTPRHYAYLKISEGCNRSCAFCAIPQIRGTHRSKPIETLVKETQFLVANGVKEVILIAQDLSFYGYDLYKQFKLPELLQQLAEIDGVEWLRLHYAYPLRFPVEALDVMKRNPNICNYLDIPLQHISDKILQNMRRGHGKTETQNLLNLFRRHIPNMAIRTTLLVGYPGETEEDFQELLDLVRSVRFDRLGVFTYSHEEGTFAGENLSDNVPDEMKQERAAILMDVQQQISQKLNEQKVGKVFKVLIDREEQDYWVGRTEYDSPEIDNEVLIEKNGGESIVTGNFYRVEITSAEAFDLYGKVV